MFVYVIVNSETQKIYVGQHKGANLRQYLQQKQSEARRNISLRSHLYAAMRKHSDGWSIHPLISNVATRAELDELEKHFIAVLNTRNPEVGYNICRGGEGYTGPGYWLGKKRPNQTVPKRPGWRNKSTFKIGNRPWNADKSGVQKSPRKNKKMIYTSEAARQRAFRGLISGNRRGQKWSEKQKQQLRQAHESCACPRHISAFLRSVAWG